MRLEIHFEAREEFLQAAQFYEAQVPDLGQRFINEIERPESIARVPADWPTLRQTPAEIHGWRQVSLFNRVRSSCGGPICIGVRSWLASPGLLAYAVRPLTIGSSDHGGASSLSQGGVDD